MRPVVRHCKLNLCILPDVLFSCVGRHAMVTLVTDKAGIDHEHATLAKVGHLLSLQGVFTKRTILSDPENIRQHYSVDWEDRPGNTDMVYRNKEHWQSVTVSPPAPLLSSLILVISTSCAVWSGPGSCFVASCPMC